MKTLLVLVILYFIIKKILNILYWKMNAIEAEYDNAYHDKLFDQSEKDYYDGYTHTEVGFYAKDSEDEEDLEYKRTRDGEYFKFGSLKYQEYTKYNNDEYKKIQIKRKSYQIVQVLDILDKYIKIK